MHEATNVTLARHRRADQIAVLVLVALGALFFIDVLLGVNQFYMRDLTRYYYPTKQVLREVVQGGEFPFWNRYFHAGQPIAANPEHEVFYPLTWLILLPSYDLGYRLHILVHVFIGLIGMYALLRSMELRPFAAFFGAIAWGLGGTYMSYINLLPIMFCAAWLPLTCLYVRRFLLHHRLRDFALAALFLGMQFLVGEPTTVMSTGFLIGMYALYRGWYDRPRVSKMLTGVLWIALISIAAIAVGAAQMIPAIDHVGESARSRPFDFELVSAWSMPWAKYAELIYPNILGHMSQNRIMWYWGGGLYPGMGSPFLFSIYSGLLVTAMAVGAAFTRPRGGRFVLILCVFSSLIALGGHTPLLRWLYDANIASSIRYPEKFLLIGIFAVIVFAAQMFDRMLRGDMAIRDSVLGFVGATTVVALTMAVVAYFPLYDRVFMKIWGMSAGPNANRMISLSRVDWIIAGFRGLVLVSLLLTIATVRRRAWAVAMTAFLLLDILPVVHELNPRMPRRFFDRPPVVATLPNRTDYRVFHEADWYGTEEIARKFFSTGDAVYWVVRNGLFPMTPAGARVRTVMERDYDKTALLPTVDLTQSVWEVKASGKTDWYQPFMAMGNAWFRAQYRNFEQEKKRVGGDFKKSLPIRFLEYEHYPRYYFADQLVTIKDRKDFVKKLTDNTYSKSVAFVQEPGFVPARGVVLEVDETANTATIDVESHGRGFLVMSITPHKYWRIAIDGKPARAVVTNIGYQGVVVPPGRHKVTMRYNNHLAMTGLAISIATIVALLTLLAIGTFRRRIAA